MDRSGIMCVALCERLYTNGVEWMIGLLKGKVRQEGGLRRLSNGLGQFENFCCRDNTYILCSRTCELCEIMGRGNNTYIFQGNTYIFMGNLIQTW